MKLMKTEMNLSEETPDVTYNLVGGDVPHTATGLEFTDSTPCAGEAQPTSEFLAKRNATLQSVGEAVLFRLAARDWVAHESRICEVNERRPEWKGHMLEHACLPDEGMPYTPVRDSIAELCIPGQDPDEAMGLVSQRTRTVGVVYKENGELKLAVDSSPSIDEHYGNLSLLWNVWDWAVKNENAKNISTGNTPIFAFALPLGDNAVQATLARATNFVLGKNGEYEPARPKLSTETLPGREGSQFSNDSLMVALMGGQPGLVKKHQAYLMARKKAFGLDTSRLNGYRLLNLDPADEERFVPTPVMQEHLDDGWAFITEFALQTDGSVMQYPIGLGCASLKYCNARGVKQ